MAYGAERAGWPQPIPGQVSAGPGAPGEERPSPSTARETLSWIRALASQWEDERSRSHGPSAPGSTPTDGK